MIEQQLEERFRLAVADEPPLGFDPDDIVDRASRRQRNRRAVAAVVAAVAAVTTATTITFAVGQGGAPVADQQTYPPAACLTSEQDIARVDQGMNKALAEHLPGTRFDPKNGPMRAFTGEGETCGLYTMYNVADVTPGQMVNVGLTYVPPDADTYADDSRFEGTSMRLPDGSELHTYRRLADPGDQPPAQEEAAVVHVRPNGMTVTAGTTDLKAVSTAELTALAIDPKLTF